MQQVLIGYGPFAQGLGVASRSLTASLVFRPLTMAEIAAEIANGRPIVIGIAPGGGFALPNASQHIAVLIGYDFTNGGDTVIVNDPFPFDQAPYSAYPNPYVVAGGQALARGQYAVPWSALINVLLWANTIFGIR